MRQCRSVGWTEDVGVQATRLLVRKGIARRRRVDGHVVRVESKMGNIESTFGAPGLDRVDLQGAWKRGWLPFLAQTRWWLKAIMDMDKDMIAVELSRLCGPSLDGQAR